MAASTRPGKRKPPPAAIPRLSRSAGLELRARTLIQGLRAGRHRSPQAGASLEFADHRAYQPGDELRTIDWKAYARSDHLLVRRYIDERSLPLVLVVDASASMRYGTPSKLAGAQFAAAILGLLALDQGDEVRLFGAGETLIPFGKALSGAQAGRRLAGLLVELPEERRVAWNICLDALAGTLRRRSLVVLCSDLLVDPAALASPLAALRGRGHDLACLQFLDRSELELPAEWTATNLVDPEGDHPDLPCHAESMRSEYAEALASHLDACRRLCAAARADHLLVAGDKQLVTVLGSWLARRGRLLGRR